MWNNKDEARIKALETEIALLKDKRAGAIKRLNAAMEVTLRATTISLSVDNLRLFIESAITHAGELRDALAPFDDGIRAVPPVAPEPLYTPPAPQPVELQQSRGFKDTMITTAEVAPMPRLHDPKADWND